MHGHRSQQHLRTHYRGRSGSYKGRSLFIKCCTLHCAPLVTDDGPQNQNFRCERAPWLSPSSIKLYPSSVPTNINTSTHKQSRIHSVSERIFWFANYRFPFASYSYGTIMSLIPWVNVEATSSFSLRPTFFTSCYVYVLLLNVQWPNITYSGLGQRRWNLSELCTRVFLLVTI